MFFLLDVTPDPKLSAANCEPVLEKMVLLKITSKLKSFLTARSRGSRMASRDDIAVAACRGCEFSTEAGWMMTVLEILALKLLRRWVCVALKYAT